MSKFRVISFIIVLSCTGLIYLLLGKENLRLYKKDHSFQFPIDFGPILDRIPNCTQSDRGRQLMILRLLECWAKVASEHQIQYRIAYGTLVGYVQRAGLLPHDRDADVIIPWTETAKLEKVAATNFSKDFYFGIQPQWKMPDYQNRSYIRSKGISFVAPNARLWDRKRDYFLDIWPSYEQSPNMTSPTLFSPTTRKIVVQYDLDYNWTTIPRNHVYPLKRCWFSGIPVWCPAQAEKLVEQIYGRTALNLSDRECVNGGWRKRKMPSS